MKKNEQRNMEDHEAHQHTHNGSTTKGGERKRRRINTQVMAENSPNLRKYINLYIQEAQLKTSMINANLHPDILW